MTSPIRKARKITSDRVDQNAPASIVINKFGGLTKFCEITGWPTSTCHGWTLKGLIPSDRFARILELGADLADPVVAGDFVPRPAVPELAVVNG